MSIAQIDGLVVAGVPATVRVSADPGTHFVWLPGDNCWDDRPLVAYTDTTIRLDNIELIKDHRGGGGEYAVTFPTPGDHSIQASGCTTDGTEIESAPMMVRVVAGLPPAFTLVAPVNGAAVDLNEAGGQLDVRLNIPGDQYFPVTISIARDGRITSEQFTGTQYQTTVPLTPTPLGPRPIAVTCADRDGLGSTQTRSVIGYDVAAPLLRVEFPPPSASLIGDGAGATVVPMYGTSADSQSGMDGGAATVSWALSPTGARTTAEPLTGNNFSSWSAEVPLTGFGAHTIYVWATDQAGNTTAVPVCVPVVVIRSYTRQ